MSCGEREIACNGEPMKDSDPFSGQDVLVDHKRANVVVGIVEGKHEEAEFLRVVALGYAKHHFAIAASDFDLSTVLSGIRYTLTLPIWVAHEVSDKEYGFYGTEFDAGSTCVERVLLGQKVEGVLQGRKVVGEPLQPLAIKAGDNDSIELAQIGGCTHRSVRNNTARL
jgi:hypothetical protein